MSYYKVYIKNLKYNKTFTLEFESPYLMEKYLNKAKYSKKIVILGKTKVD